MALKKGYKQLVDEANARVETLTAEQAVKLAGDPNVQLVDVRDVRELEREGVVPGAFHAPRGMLEFWVDPDSPYYKDVFGSGKKFVLFCAAGWRSALAADRMREMGFDKIAHIDGGFGAWKSAGGPTAERAKKA